MEEEDKQEIEEFENCILSGFPLSNFSSCLKDKRHKPFIKYSININGNQQRVVFDYNSIEDIKDYIAKNSHLFRGLFLNNHKIPKSDEEWEHSSFMCICPVIYKRDLEELIKEVEPYTKPDNKLERIFLSIVEQTNHPGEWIELNEVETGWDFIHKHFIDDWSEFQFYLFTLPKQGLIELNSEEEKEFVRYRITYDGLIKSIQLKEEGTNSNRCFVAMSFDKEDEAIFDEAIEPACNETNYRAIRVDRIHTEAEQTINDLIIAEIKKSKFLISDFTKQKNGVYFEAGYGLGRGKKVIYTCHRDHFNKLHFDVNHFPVLIYENTSELKEMLINKINAFINE